jgi:hypothetical protein
MNVTWIYYFATLDFEVCPVLVSPFSIYFSQSLYITFISAIVSLLCCLLCIAFSSLILGLSFLVFPSTLKNIILVINLIFSHIFKDKFITSASSVLHSKISVIFHDLFNIHFICHPKFESKLFFILFFEVFWNWIFWWILREHCLELDVIILDFYSRPNKNPKNIAWPLKSRYWRISASITITKVVA